MFKKRLKELRLERNLTQKKLGIKSYMQDSQICNLEKGNREPSLSMLLRLANALEVDMNTLTGYDKYIVSDNDVNYGTNIMKEEIKLILELRKNVKLYEDLIEDPKRTIAYIRTKY